MREIFAWFLVVSLCGLVAWFRSRAFTAETLNYAMRGTASRAEGVEYQLGVWMTRASEAEADRDYWRALTKWKGGLGPHPTAPDFDAMADNIMARIQPPPMNLPFGSLSNPVQTMEGPAYWHRVEDFTGPSR